MIASKRGLTAATAWRNRFAPHADHLIVGLPCCEQVAGAAQDIGLGDAYNSDIAAEYGAPVINGTLTPTAGADHPYLDFLSDAENNRAYDPPTGYVELFAGNSESDVSLTHFTLMIRFRGLGPQESFARFIFHRGAAATAAGHLGITREANTDTLRVGFRDVLSQLVTLNATIADWSVPHTVVVTGGARGLRLYVDGHEAVATNAVTDPVVVVKGSTVLLGAGLAGSRGQFDFYGFALWDKQFDDDDIRELMADPYLPFRPTPDEQAEFATYHPEVGRLTADGATLALTSGLGALVFDDALLWRVVYGTNPYDLDCLAESAGIESSAAISVRSLVQLAGLESGTRYYYRAELSADDGATWRPLPCGLGTFRTDPGRTGNVRMAFIADCHVCGSEDGGLPDLVTGGFGADEFHAGVNARRKCIAAYYAERDLRGQHPDVIVDFGDFFTFDSFVGPQTQTLDQLLADMRTRGARTRNFHYQRYKTGAHLVVVGNHEATGGNNCRGDAGHVGPVQMAATIALKSFTLNPDNGEDEGQPSLRGATPSWVPPLGYDAGDATLDIAWRAAHVMHADNGSPLENYGVLSYGPMDIFFLDINRYSNVGDPEGTRLTKTRTGDRFRRGPYWTLGDVQRAWLRAALAKSDAPWKVLCLHNLPGGRQVSNAYGGYYGRSSGVHLTTPEMQWLVNLCRQHGAFIFKGHDHRFAHVVQNGVSIITVPTPSAPSQTAANDANVGWHYDRYEDEYGAVESAALGYPNIIDSRGRPMPPELRRAYNILGYLVIDATPTTFNVRLRQTDYTRKAYASAVSDLFVARLLAERFVGPTCSPSDDVVEFAEPYRDIGYAPLADDLTGAWWDDPPADHQGDNVGWPDQPFDQPGSTTRTLSGTEDADVAVLHVPRDLAELELERPEAAGAAVMSGANVYQKSVTLGAPDWQKLAVSRMVMDVTVSMPVGNSQNVLVRVAGGDGVEWPPGTTVTLKGVDVSSVEVMGAEDDQVLVVGTSAA